MMMPDPKQLANVQLVTKDIKGTIICDYKTNTLTIRLATQDPSVTPIAHDLLEQLTQQLAMQLNAFFAIKGEITQVGDKAKKLQ